MAAAASTSALIQLTGPWLSSETPVEALSAALGNHPDKQLRALFEKSQRAFDEIASRHLPRWVVTLSWLRTTSCRWTASVPNST